MLFDDVPYDEFDWQTEIDAAELAEIRDTRRDSEDVEIETARPCCDSPANYVYIAPAGTCDPETGYADEAFYECSCGSRIAESDYACIRKWHATKHEIEPDAVPLEIDEQTRVETKRIA